MQFEEVILPHLDAAYNLARWLTGNDDDAQDVVQDASLRALRFFSGFRGGSGRAWLLTIVRNTFYNWLEENRPKEFRVAADEEVQAMEDHSVNPQVLIERSANVEAVRRAIEKLPVEFREVIVLRELEECSYKEIADVAGVPIGTVMSRLARARKQLQEVLSEDSEAGNYR
ncbi:MAG: sigma-70 family RNA polymerase sigma factor [Verrucomicrobiota bacterium]|nr:sigma-70 family RNA polymerase sigma factor [Verrucomicrobiota bacterium]